MTNVQKNKGGKFMHYGTVEQRRAEASATPSTASIDTARRQAIMPRPQRHPPARRRAARRVLGDHAHQAGSLVEPDRLRFDFTHFESITPEQLAEIDRLVNDADPRGLTPIVTEALPD